MFSKEKTGEYDTRAFDQEEERGKIQNRGISQEWEGRPENQNKIALTSGFTKEGTGSFCLAKVPFQVSAAVLSCAVWYCFATGTGLFYTARQGYKISRANIFISL